MTEYQKSCPSGESLHVNPPSELLLVSSRINGMGEHFTDLSIIFSWISLGNVMNTGISVKYLVTSDGSSIHL